MKHFKRILALLTISVLVLESSFVLVSPAEAKADDLVIEDNGGIVLLITSGDTVLAAETGSATQTSPAPAPTTQTTKVVVPPKTDSTVKIDPKPSKDNKVKITVQTPAAPATTPNVKQAPTKTGTAPSTQPQLGAPVSTSPAPTTVSAPQTAVDKVILNGPDQKPVITISGDNSKNLTIQNGSANLSTSLPVQVDNSVSPNGTVKHDLSVTTASGPVKLSILPDVAVKAAQSETANSNLQTSKTDVTLTTTNTGLIRASQDPTYTVKEQKKGKVLGIIPVTFNSEVQISGTSGKTVSTWQSPLSIFGFLVK